MKTHQQYDFRTAYIDLLLNVLTGILFIFVLTTSLINEKKQDEGIKKNAEFIVSATWDSKIDCDVDIWAKDPNNNIVSYKAMSKGIMHLERDDLGFYNDKYEDQQKKIVVNTDNQEMWVLRGKQSGMYIVNVHLYGCKLQGGQTAVGTVANLDVDVKLIQVNPTVKTLFQKTVKIEKIFEEKSGVVFDIHHSGVAENIRQDEELKILQIL